MKLFKKALCLITAFTLITSMASFGGIKSMAATWDADISLISDHPSTKGSGEFAGCINGMSFQQDGIVTYKGYQYAAYWDINGYLTLARRQYNQSTKTFGDWTEITFNYQITRAGAPDSHNTISIGISKGDGVLHMSFDHHAVDINYLMSKPGFLDNPSMFSVSNFYNCYYYDYLGTYGSIWQKMITYPRFLSLQNGDMILEFRYGKATNYFYYYTSSTHSWKEIGAYVRGEDVFDFSKSAGTVCAYINGLDTRMVNGKERIYTTWVTRDEGNNATNKDMYSAYSDDYGYTWYSLRGKKIGDLRQGELGGMSSQSADAKDWDIPITGTGLMNQTAQCVDDVGVVHTMNKHTLDAATVSKAQVPLDFSTYSDQYIYHYWITTDGTPHREIVAENGVPAAPHYWTRYPIVSYGGCLYMVMNQLRIYKGVPKQGDGNNGAGYTWTCIYNNSAEWMQGRNNIYGSYGCECEPLVDKAVLKDGILSIMDLGSDKKLYTFDINLNKVSGNITNITRNSSKGAPAVKPADPPSAVGQAVRTPNTTYRLYTFRTVNWWNQACKTFSLQGCEYSGPDDKVKFTNSGGHIVNIWGFRSEGNDGVLFYATNTGATPYTISVSVAGKNIGSQTVPAGANNTVIKFPFQDQKTFSYAQFDIYLSNNATGFLSDVFAYTGNVVPTQTQTQPQPTPSQSETTTTTTTTTQKTQPPTPVTGDTFMPADKWESAWSGGSVSASGGYATATWSENSAEYAIYDYNYHKNVNLPADTKALKFTVVVNSIGNQNVPLEVYMGGNNPVLGKYSGAFIDLGKGSEIVGKPLTFTFNLADFTGGASGTEKRPVTVEQLKGFSPFEFRVRADDMTTGLSGISFSVSDIVAVSESGSTTTTKATTVAPTTTTTTTTKATTTTTTTTSGTQPIKKGDVNGDGELNVSDVQALLVLVQKGQKGDTRVTDMNNDGNVDIIDVNLLLNMVLKG